MSMLINSFRFQNPRPPLDILSGAATAYGLRNLSSSFSGAVVRVRRSNDNTESDFTAANLTDGTLLTWVGANNGFIRTWYDQSGNARHMQQATTGNQPQLVTNGSFITAKGKPAISFAGNKELALASFLSLTSHTCFFVCTYLSTITVATSAQFLWGGNFTTTFDIYAIGAWTSALTNERIAWGKSVTQNWVGQCAADIPAGTYINAASWNGSSPVIFQNNQNQALTNGSSGGFTAVNYPATFGRLGKTSDGFSGSFSELVFYTTDKTSDISNFLTNQNLYYQAY